MGMMFDRTLGGFPLACMNAHQDRTGQAAVPTFPKHVGGGATTHYVPITCHHVVVFWINTGAETPFEQEDVDLFYESESRRPLLAGEISGKK